MLRTPKNHMVHLTVNGLRVQFILCRTRSQRKRPHYNGMDRPKIYLPDRFLMLMLMPSVSQLNPISPERGLPDWLAGWSLTPKSVWPSVSPARPLSSRSTGGGLYLVAASV